MWVAGTQSLKQSPLPLRVCSNRKLETGARAESKPDALMWAMGCFTAKPNACPEMRLGLFVCKYKLTSIRRTVGKTMATKLLGSWKNRVLHVVTEPATYGKARDSPILP